MTVLSLLLFAAAMSPGLRISAEIAPTTWGHRREKVEFAITLSNPADRPVDLLFGVVGDDAYFFDAKISDAVGKVVRSAAEPRFLATDDLPEPVFRVIPPHSAVRVVLDWRLLYNLPPGKYRIAGVYRVEPERSPNADGHYGKEIRQRRAFVGRLESAPVDVIVVK
jgi:hypothetical protein